MARGVPELNRESTPRSSEIIGGLAGRRELISLRGTGSDRGLSGPIFAEQDHVIRT